MKLHPSISQRAFRLLPRAWAFTLFTLACFASLSGAGAQTLSFESAGDASLLNQMVSSTAATTSLLGYTAGAGTSGGGGLVNSSSSTDVTAIYNAASFNLSTGAGYTFSLDVHRPSGNGSGQISLLQLGLFASNNVGTGTSNQYMSFKLVGPGTTGTANTYQVQLQNWDSNQPAATNIGSSFVVATANTDWYRLVGTLTLSDAATKTFSYSFSYLDLGSDGTATPTTVASFSGTLVNATLAADTTLWLGFRDIGTVFTAVDNLTISAVAVPEPATAWLLLPAAFALWASRRRLARL